MSAPSLHILHSRTDIEARVRCLAQQLSEDYRGRVPLLVGVLKGAFVFLADLMRCLTIPAEVDFVRLASYGDATESRGGVAFTKDLEVSIEGRDVLVVEDIVDSGQTLKLLLAELERRRPRSLRTCVLLDKKCRREVDIDVDYVGFAVEDGFVVGFGLDWAEAFRYLPDICIVETGEG
jgi:hypoxanthine phosphoribosyltransferase